jgi:mono/diheme cytochrome c family protein
MQFPFFYPPHIGIGAAIGAEAVVHVLFSHGFAIGVMAIVALAECLGVKRGAPAWEAFARRLARLAAIIITSLGAVTGVGIWFFTSVFAPRAIASMLRIFFWPWFIEWLVFVAEVAVLLVYYFTWESWQGERKLRHLRLGVAYVALALVSAVLITGILSFMLTSDGWPWSQRFWQAFFTPSFAPQLALRVAGSLALGALFSLAFLYLCCREPGFQKDASRLFGAILLASTALTALSCWWYFAVAPSAFKSHAISKLMLHTHPSGHAIFWALNAAGMALVLAAGAAAWRRRLTAVRVALLPALLAGVLLVGEYEYIREFMRGPYILPGYMYASGVLIEERPYLSERGLLNSSYWYQAMPEEQQEDAAGSFLFAHNCATCHTMTGVGSMAGAVSGRSEDGLYAILGHTHEMAPWMPPFTGTEEERRTLAAYLYRLAQGEVKETERARFPLADQGRGRR